jgi:hypothetical protein
MIHRIYILPKFNLSFGSRWNDLIFSNLENLSDALILRLMHETQLYDVNLSVKENIDAFVIFADNYENGDIPVEIDFGGLYDFGLYTFWGG